MLWMGASKWWFHRERSLRTRYLTFNRRANLSILLDWRNRACRFGSCKTLFLWFWRHSYLPVWLFLLRAGRRWRARYLIKYFDISMENVHAVELIEAFDDLNEDVPDLEFAEMSPFILLFADSVREVAFGSIFHDDAIVSSWSTIGTCWIRRWRLRDKQRCWDAWWMPKFWFNSMRFLFLFMKGCLIELSWEHKSSDHSTFSPCRQNWMYLHPVSPMEQSP